MDFRDSIRDIAKRSVLARETAQTEEATKNSVVMPFIRALGFDVFDLRQVIPEYTADVGLKKGEKVDYALMINNEVAMLIEAKPINIDLGKAQYSQLYRYFGTETGAKIAILTNGVQFWFFTDIDAPNRMDTRPFFTFDLEGYDEDDLKELVKFQRESFDVTNIVRTASQLKYTNAAASYIAKLMNNADDDFIRLVGKQIYDGNLTKAVIEQLAQPVNAAFRKVVRDQIQERLNVALKEPDVGVLPVKDGEPISEVNNNIVTTDEELGAFRIVQAIASEVADPERITIRDSKSYCSILFDDNNRKPICRLYFNAKSVKYVGIFDAEKKEIRHTIEAVTNIFKHRIALLEVVRCYS